MTLFGIEKEQLDGLNREQLYKLIFEMDEDNKVLYKMSTELVQAIKEEKKKVNELTKRLNDTTTCGTCSRQSDSNSGWSNIEADYAIARANKASLYYK